MQDEHENQLGKFILGFSRKELVEEVEQLVAKTASGTISLCFPKKVDEENLHLFVTPGKHLTGPEETALTVAILDKLGYDHTVPGTEIVVRFSPVFNISIYPYAIALTTKNFENKSVGNFLDTYYSQFFNSPQGGKKTFTENTTQKMGLDTVLANVDEFLQGATREEVERFSRLCSEKIQSNLSEQKLVK